MDISEPFPKGQIFDASKLKEFSDDNFKFDENGRKFSKPVENTVGKGEIACYEQFFFTHSVFLRLVLQTSKTPVFVWERVKYNHLIKNKAKLQICFL